MNRSRRDRIPLFMSGNAYSAQQAALAAACNEVDALPEDYFLNTDVETLIPYFQRKYGVVVPTIDRNRLVGTHHERAVEVHDAWGGGEISVQGEAYDFEIPFEGDADLFKLQPSTIDSGPPYAEVYGNTLRFTIEGRVLAPENVKQHIDGLLSSIEKYLNWHRQTWSAYEQNLLLTVRQRIDARRARLSQQKGAAEKLAGLGIKLKEKAGDARTYVPPTVRQKIQPVLPPMRPAAPPQPTLDQSQYETILGLVRGAGRSIEQSSSRTRELDEEALRDMFLVPLNAHFGTATGEAFNFQGKTDVLIRHNQGNLFVAEFKIWAGDKHFLATIDQLLSYLTWRDTKAAIVIFSRNAGFSAVVEKIRSLTKSHAVYVSGPERLDETSDRYIFALPQDKDRKVIVSILAFDLGPRAS